MAARMPDRVVARVDKRLRAGKVLIDWGQNDRHKSTVAAYSLRAKLDRPTVSAPLDSDELQTAVESADESLLRPHQMRSSHAWSRAATASPPC
jgi:bifunctional non-homologous end joining protein LigD